MTLIGNRHVEASDPGAVGSGHQWLNATTGNLYERDTTNSSWTLIGNVNEANYGQLPLTGGIMSGAISGVTGWAPLDSPNFTTVAKLLGIDLATVNDLSGLQTTLEALISSKVASAIASSASAISISNNIVITSGTAGPAATYLAEIVLTAPVFPDGVTASASQCHSLAVCTGGNNNISKGSNELRWVCYDYILLQPRAVNYLIIATR